jgi:hypothetical protein
MKHAKSIVLVCAFLGFTAFSHAAKVKVIVQVKGLCGMCKSRIEKAAKEAGASSAEWDEGTMTLNVSFKRNKTNMEKIQSSIAAAGHDNGNFKAPDDVYDRLPGCCQYDRSQTAMGQSKSH